MVLLKKSGKQTEFKNCDPTGKIINKTEIQAVATAETWPNGNSEKVIKELAEHIDNAQQNDFVALAPSLRDISTNTLGVELAKKYEPRVMLRGLGLSVEKYSSAWGGMYYRVLSNKKMDQNPDKICLQYIYMWVNQKFPLTIWNWVVPLTCLMILGLFFNSMHYFLGESVISLESYQNQPELVFIYPNSFLVASVVVAIIFLVLAFFTFRLRRLIPLHSGIISLIGFFYAVLLLIELLIPESRRIVVREIQIGSVIFVISLGIVTILLLLAIISSTILLIFQHSENWFFSMINRRFQSIRSRMGIHTMDYEPIFVYLQSTPGVDISNANAWEFMDSVWDSVHYCSKQLSNSTIDFNEYKNSKQFRQLFLIDTVWHPFRPLSKLKLSLFSIGWKISLISCLGIGAGILLWWVCEMFFQLDYILLILQVVTLEPWNFSVKFLFAGLFVVCIIATIISKPTELGTVTERSLLSKRSLPFEVRFFHLTCEKLNVLWNLPGDAAFIIQKKLQDPILFKMKKQPDFETFYDNTHKKAQSSICKLYKNKWLEFLEVGIIVLLILFVAALIYQLSLLFFS